MSANLLVLISSGKEAIGKASTGMMYAINAKKNGWMDDVRLIFFGPSEELIANPDENDDFLDLLKTAMETGISPMACKAVSEQKHITENLELKGIDMEYVGGIISAYIKKGYEVLTF